MITFAKAATAAIPLILATTPAFAAAKLSGAYIGEMLKLCQAIGSASAAPSDGGLIEQSAGVFTFSGNKLTVKGVDYFGSSITHNQFIKTVSVNSGGSFALSGTANPYTATVNGVQYKAFLGQVDGASIAHHAILIGTRNYFAQNSHDCSIKITIDRQ